MKKITLILAFTIVSKIAGAQANTSLSNLTTTAINKSLLPGTPSSFDLGADLIPWRDIYFNGIIYHNNTQLLSHSVASQSIFLGYNASSLPNTGTNNTCVGGGAGIANTSGTNNSFLGHSAGRFNTIGGSNTFIGNKSGQSNTSGSTNTFMGFSAGQSNTTGGSNTFVGVNAGIGNTTGQANTFIGTGGSTTPAITGGFNSMLGNSARVGAGNISFSTAIGFNAIVNADHKVRLGGTSVTVIEGQVAYSFPSDGRFKTNVQENVPGLSFINKLRPVTYNFETQKFDAFLNKNNPEYKPEASLFTASEKIKQSGFIAQEVEIAANELGYDFNGVHAPESDIDNYSMSYELLIVPMVKAMQELDAKNKQLEKENTELKSRLDKIEALLSINTTTNETSKFQKLVLESEGKVAMLGQNVPNPFTGKTVIQYYLPENVKSAQLIVTTLNGVQLIAEQLTNRGQGTIEVDATKLASGNYIYTLIADGSKVYAKQFSLNK